MGLVAFSAEELAPAGCPPRDQQKKDPVSRLPGREALGDEGVVGKGHCRTRAAAQVGNIYLRPG